GRVHVPNRPHEPANYASLLKDIECDTTVTYLPREIFLPACIRKVCVLLQWPACIHTMPNCEQPILNRLHRAVPRIFSVAPRRRHSRFCRRGQCQEAENDPQTRRECRIRARFTWPHAVALCRPGRQNGRRRV